METKVILKYRRECDRWLCSECDSENSMATGKCTVCGHAKRPDAIILRKWTEENDVSPVLEKKTTTASRIYEVEKEPDYERKTEKGGMGCIIALAFLVLAIIIMLITIGGEVGASAPYLDYLAN